MNAHKCHFHELLNNVTTNLLSMYPERAFYTEVCELIHKLSDDKPFVLLVSHGIIDGFKN